VQPNLANIIEATALVPENDRIYSDCPHATAILIIASYVDDDLALTNCAALAAEFEVHCNVKFSVNAEGPVNWYLSVKHDRYPISEAASAHQHLSTLTSGAQRCRTPCLSGKQKREKDLHQLSRAILNHLKENQCWSQHNLHTLKRNRMNSQELSEEDQRAGEAAEVVIKILCGIGGGEPDQPMVEGTDPRPDYLGSPRLWETLLRPDTALLMGHSTLNHIWSGLGKLVRHYHKRMSFVEPYHPITKNKGNTHHSG